MMWSITVPTGKAKMETPARLLGRALKAARYWVVDRP